MLAVLIFRRWSMYLALIAMCAPGTGTTASASTIVLANRSTKVVEFEIPALPAAQRHYKLSPAAIAAVRVNGSAIVQFVDDGRVEAFEVGPNSVHFFHRGRGRLELETIGLGFANTEGEATAPAAKTPPQGIETSAPPASAGQPLNVSVRLLVDEEERATRQRWEQRLRKRLETASAIIRQHCGVSFRVDGFGTWQSDNNTTDFEKSLREFELASPQGTTRLTIGFTSQYQVQEGRVHLGGTRGPLGTHILLREWSQHVSEPERLELLLHELGHFLGATHSPEADSVMRPLLADRKALDRSFRIGFDPVNTLVMNLVAEGLQPDVPASLRALPIANRRALAQIYTTLGKVQPDDPATPQYLALVAERPSAEVSDVQPASLPLSLPATEEAVSAPARAPVSDPTFVELLPRVTAATQAVLKSIVEGAKENAARPQGRVAAGEELFRHTGDHLTEFYVRRAARAALRESEDTRQPAFFLALAVALDTSEVLRRHPLTAAWLEQLETTPDRTVRLQVIGNPTLLNRHDLAQHFFVSAGIASIGGTTLAESVGVAKEMRDCQTGSGFSFTDLCADLAGIALVERIRDGEIRLRDLARDFQVTNHLPSVEGLQDGLSSARFDEQFASIEDPRFVAAVQSIRQRIGQLYRKDR